MALVLNQERTKPAVEFPPPNNCRRGDNCLIHLHSAAGHASLFRQFLPFQRIQCPDGIPRFRIVTSNLETCHSDVDILAAHFKQLKEDAQILHSKLYDRALVVLPTTLKKQGRQSNICRAAQKAGFKALIFYDRALVAAHNHRIRSTEPKTYLIFELGGDILEISLLTPALEVKSSISDTGCPLFNKLISQLPHTSGIDISGDWPAIFRFRKACELAKDAICSGESNTVLFFPHQDKLVYTYLCREEVVQLNLDLLRVSIHQCLMEARARQEDVDEVILAGASTVIPEVRGVIREFFPRHTLRCHTDIHHNAAQVAESLSCADSIPFCPLVNILNFGDFFFFY